MSDRPEALERYLEMWNERDPELIRGHLDRCVSENCLWVDPIHQHIGRDALEANVRGFRSTYPDADGMIERVDGSFGALDRVGPDE
jgi:SnoaL-like protein